MRWVWVVAGIVLCIVNWMAAYTLGPFLRPRLQLTTTHSILKGHIVTADDLTWTPCRADHPSLSRQDVIGNVASQDIAANGMLRRDFFASPEPTASPTTGESVTTQRLSSPPSAAGTPPAQPVDPESLLSDALLKSSALTKDAGGSAQKIADEFFKSFAAQSGKNLADKLTGNSAQDASQLRGITSAGTTTPAQTTPTPHTTPSSTSEAIPGEAVTVHFATAKAEIVGDEDRENLRRFAQRLLQHDRCHVEIRGFTDSTGTDRANLFLSWRRADSLAKFLIACKIDAWRITIAPRSMSEAAAGPNPNDRRADARELCRN